MSSRQPLCLTQVNQGRTQGIICVQQILEVFWELGENKKKKKLKLKKKKKQATISGSTPQIFWVLRQVELFPTNLYTHETGLLASPQLMWTPSGKAALFHLREHFAEQQPPPLKMHAMSLSFNLEQTLAFLHLYSLYHYDALYNVMM